MNKDSISTKSGINSIIMFILGTATILSGATRANQDSWIAVILAIIMAIPIFIIYGKISSTFPKENLYTIFDIVFGKILGRIFSIMYIFYFFHLASVSTRNMTEFVQVVSFPETPQYFSAIFVGALTVFMIRSGIRTLASGTDLLLPFILVLILSTSLMAIPKFEYSNIMPVLSQGWKPVLHSGFSLFTFPFGESVAFLALFGHLNDNNKPTKIYLIGLLIGGCIFVVTTIRNILLLGFPNLAQMYFSSYYASSLISMGDFIQRPEVGTAIVLLVCGFIKICVLSIAVCIGVSKLFNFPNYEDIAVPMVLLMILLSLILYTNTMEMVEFLEVYMYYAAPFQIFIPILTLIVAKIRKPYKSQ